MPPMRYIYFFINDEFAGFGAGGYRQQFWTSGSDAAVTGEWIWTATSQPLNYTNWQFGLPNNGTGEDYLLMNYRLGNWDDWYDDSRAVLRAICESNQ